MEYSLAVFKQVYNNSSGISELVMEDKVVILALLFLIYHYMVLAELEQMPE
jgi:hypothetical protein